MTNENVTRTVDIFRMPNFRDLGCGPSEGELMVAYNEVKMLDCTSKDERRFDSSVADSFNDKFKDGKQFCMEYVAGRLHLVTCHVCWLFLVIESVGWFVSTAAVFLLPMATPVCHGFSYFTVTFLPSVGL